MSLNSLKLNNLIKKKRLRKLQLFQKEIKQRFCFRRVLFNKLDKELDGACHGPKWLADSRIAELVCSSLHYLDGTDYVLEAYCLMPNHVHLVCTPLINNDTVVSISKIMQSLKGFAAHRANQWLGRKGEFWQHESYDHVVRDHLEFIRIVNYVLDNPARAGLPAKWLYCRNDLDM